MPLTTSDLQHIRQIMDESIANHPRFDEMRVDITDEVSDVITGALVMIDKRFNTIEKRLNNLRIVTR